jgi:succinate dehydrogenase/fumarate reductase cytochrome b subunit
MRKTIWKLFGASFALALFAIGSWYRGFRLSALSKPAQSNALAKQFAQTPGDGWMLFAVLLLLLALAIASAGTMLWMQERKTES